MNNQPNDSHYSPQPQEHSLLSREHHMVLRKCDDMLSSLMSEELCQIWWSTQNREFGWKTPAEVFIKNPSEVEAYLNSVIDGTGS